MLKNLTSEKLISLQIDAVDWKDAIRHAALPLKNEHKIEQSYIEAIIESVNQHGPYFVLIPHVALPHARPEEGAIESAIGIATLKNPVSFGNKENDPVRYLFCLSAKDSTSHIDALADLANLFENKDFFDLLDTATDPKQIMKFLESM